MSRAYVICHMLASLDGKIDGRFMSAPESAPAIGEYARLRSEYGCRAVIYGTTTMAEGFADGVTDELPHAGERYFQEDYAAPSDVQNYIVSIDPKGVLKWSSKYIEKKKRPRAHVIEVLTEQVPNDYLAYLHSFDMDSAETNKPLAPDSRPAAIRKSVEGSLKRLGVDCIDLYYQHRGDPAVPVEEVAGVMSDLIREGKIAHWGLSETDADTIRRAHAVCPVTAIQNRYSMMARWYETLFPTLEELHIGYVAFSPLANGFLSAKYGKDAKFEAGTDYRSVMPQFSAEGIDQNRALLDLLHRMAEEKGATPAQISLAWMLCKKPYLVPIPGTRRLERLRENAGAADMELSAQEVEALGFALDAMEMSEVFGGSRVVSK